MSFAETWIDMEIVMQSKVNQKEKNKYCITSPLCGIQKNGRDEPNAKQKQKRHKDNKYMDTKRGNEE